MKEYLYLFCASLPITIQTSLQCVLGVFQQGHLQFEYLFLTLIYICNMLFSIVILIHVYFTLCIFF